jgi:hypothetical protein
MSSTPLALTAKDMAELVLRRCVKTFRNIKPQLYGRGMPKPLDLPGEQLWDRAEVEAWLVTLRRTEVEPKRAEPEHNAARRAAAAPVTIPLPEVAKRSRGRPRKLAAPVRGAA